MNLNNPRKLSLVKFNYAEIPKNEWDMYPFVENRAYIFLGMIPNMEGHCVVIDTHTNITYCGYHTEDFIELTADEV